MRLLSAHLRDYRLHRDRSVHFDPRFTVIAGPNQSGKSTLAEALHRALFVSAKAGGDLQKSMRSDPFRDEPEVDLSFEAAGERWELRKRFAATRGSVVLRNSSGRSLQGDAAEERLAELIGTAAVDRTAAATRQLKERWGHLWVWQGDSSSNPVALSTQAYDHDRLVERLQAGADLGVTSELDLAVIEDIQRRWSAIFTDGGAKQKPRPRAGSPLRQAIDASTQAQQELEAIERLIIQQNEDAQALERAAEMLARISGELPLQRQNHRVLQQRLARSVELEAQIGSQQPLLDGLLRELTGLQQDRSQLQLEQHRVETLTGLQAPRLARLAELRAQLPALEAGEQEALTALKIQQQAGGKAAARVQSLETAVGRLRRLEERERLTAQLAVLEQLRARFRALSRDLAALPEVDGAGVERLRQLEAALQAARVRAESLSAGIEVIRAGQSLHLNGEPLAAGSSQLLSQPGVLQVGSDVELRLVPGGGTSTVEAARAVERAHQALASALNAKQLPSVEAAALAERRRSALLAERQSVVEQARRNGDDASLRQRLATVVEELGELGEKDPEPTGTLTAHAPNAGAATTGPEELEGGADAAIPTDAQRLQTRISQLEEALGQARANRNQAQTAEQEQQARLQQTTEVLQGQRRAIETLEQELAGERNQLLEARTRCESLLERHGAVENLASAIAALEQKRHVLETSLTALRTELGALDPAGLSAEDQRLARLIAELEQQERQTTEARIRAEERLHGDGQTDLQAEREQRQAALESRLQEQERLEKEAAMLTLLRRLLEEEQNAMGSQYTVPILSRIGRYLAEVFPEPPQASLSYDARGGFQGLQWRRGEEAAFGFEALSTGAREQFAAAIRVSMAEVLAGAYDGSLPLLFDDAFANSDPERQAGVHRMLQKAAERGLQVILLTCDPERSKGIDGARQIQLGR